MVKWELDGVSEREKREKGGVLRVEKVSYIHNTHKTKPRSQLVFFESKAKAAESEWGKFFVLLMMLVW